MQFRTLQITLLSGKNLPSKKMPIYAVVLISGETGGFKQEYTKPSVSDGGANPTWNSQMESKVDDTALQKNSLILEFRLLCNAADDKQVVVGRLNVSVKELFDSRKSGSPYVGSVSGEDGGGELTFSYDFTDDSAPNIASGSGWNRVENATRAAAGGAGEAMKAAADVAGEATKAAASVAGGALKAAAIVANEAMRTLAKGVTEAKKMVESKDEKNKGFAKDLDFLPKNEAGWFGWGPKKRSKTEIAIEAKMNERRNFKPPPQTPPKPSHQPTTSTTPGTSHPNSTSYKPGQTQADHSSTSYKPGQTQADQNSTFNTGEAMGTLYETATKFMPSIGTMRGHFGQGGRKDKNQPK